MLSVDTPFLARLNKVFFCPNLQIGTMAGQAFIFDLLSDTSVMAEGKLRRILESEEIIKVREMIQSGTVNFIYGFGKISCRDRCLSAATQW
jgi:hypothetical protein